jgi:glutamate/tyrosine decarboxylase-like PLP-dependent enzyme
MCIGCTGGHIADRSRLVHTPALAITQQSQELRLTRSLDPADWTSFRADAHSMLDDILDYVRDLRDDPVWRPMPDSIRAGFAEPLPKEPVDLAEAHRRFMTEILPYAGGNPHPGFMGWVQGAGTPVGIVAEMLAAGLNANLGGRDHAPIELERQIVRWLREMTGFPETAEGIFVTGTSMANFIGVLVARARALGVEVRRSGVGAARLAAYTSAASHGSIARAMELSGIGTDALRIVPVNEADEMDLAALTNAITRDRADGFVPFLISGSAGTVDVGAIDDLDGLADIAARERIWLHVDGAYGALGLLAPDIAPLLRGIERADSLAFDFHKWGQVPYDAGFVLVRDGALQRATFAAQAAYLTHHRRGMAAGDWWPCDYGPDLSRSFKALKTWFTFRVHGSDALGASISGTCQLARELEATVEATPELELLAPVRLNIVCFRYRADLAAADAINTRIVADLQEEGRVAPSLTTIRGRVAIRAAIVNHRTDRGDIDALVREVLARGRAIATEVAE